MRRVIGAVQPATYFDVHDYWCPLLLPVRIGLANQRRDRCVMLGEFDVEVLGWATGWLKHRRLDCIGVMTDLTKDSME